MRFIRLFGYECIDSLVADREFIGKDLIEFLNKQYENPVLHSCQTELPGPESQGLRPKSRLRLFHDLKVEPEKFYRWLLYGRILSETIRI